MWQQLWAMLAKRFHTSKVRASVPEPTPLSALCCGSETVSVRGSSLCTARPEGVDVAARVSDPDSRRRHWCVIPSTSVTFDPRPSQTTIRSRAALFPQSIPRPIVVQFPAFPLLISRVHPLLCVCVLRSAGQGRFFDPQPATAAVGPCSPVPARSHRGPFLPFIQTVQSSNTTPMMMLDPVLGCFSRVSFGAMVC